VLLKPKNLLDFQRVKKDLNPIRQEALMMRIVAAMLYVLTEQTLPEFRAGTLLQSFAIFTRL
jgi:hypothetical protein